MEAELSGRDWKRIKAELNETRPRTSETVGPAMAQILGPLVQRDEAAILMHIADALRNDQTESDQSPLPRLSLPGEAPSGERRLRVSEKPHSEQ
jgi:hypothetical protein